MGGDFGLQLRFKTGFRIVELKDMQRDMHFLLRKAYPTGRAFRVRLFDLKYDLRYRISRVVCVSIESTPGRPVK